jgi:hypothetical protein
MIRRAGVSNRTLVLIAALVGVLLAAVVFLRVMSHERYRLTGTNSVGVPAHVEIPPGQRVCQGGQFVPKGTGAVAPWAGRGHEPGGPVAVTVSQGGRTIARGRSPETYRTAVTRFPLDTTIERDVRDAVVCFENRSPSVMNFYGDFVQPGQPSADAPQFGPNGPTNLRLDYFTADRRSWWQTVSPISHRFPLFKAPFFGPWTFWLAMAVVLALSALAVVRVVREVRA